MYDGKSIRNFTTNDELSVNFIWTIYKDKEGKLWFGTDGGGVFNFNGDKFVPFSNNPKHE